MNSGDDVRQKTGSTHGMGEGCPNRYPGRGYGWYRVRSSGRDARQPIAGYDQREVRDAHSESRAGRGGHGSVPVRHVGCSAGACVCARWSCMTDTGSDVPTLFENWCARNYLRVRVLLGFVLLSMVGFNLAAGEYIGAVIYAVFGGWMVGGWSAIRRLLFDPRRWQAKQWYYILIDKRRTATRPKFREEGACRVEMRPTLHGWREVRNRD